MWGQTQEMIAFAYTAGVNIASYNADDGSYQMLCPTTLGPHIPVDYARPTIYLAFTGSNHFQVVLSQDFPLISIIQPQNKPEQQLIIMVVKEEVEGH